jgi:large subunit ribosomal protein L1
VAEAVKEVKMGKISFKIDKFGIIHTSVGRVGFNPEQLKENAKEVLMTLSKMKPSAAKGTYFKSIYMATTMSPSVQVDVKSVPGL